MKLLKYLSFILLSLTLIVGCSDEEENVVLAPEMSGVESKYTILENEVLELSPLIANDNQSVYSWFVDGKVVATTLKFTFIPANPGEYKLIFKAENQGGIDTIEITVTVIALGEPPVMTGLEDEYEIEVDEALQLIPFVVSDTDVTYSWLLNDEETGSDAEYLFVSSDPGILTLVLKVENRGGVTEKEIKIVVTPKPTTLSVESSALLYIEAPDYAQNAETINWSVLEAESDLYRLSYADTKSPVFVAVDEGEYKLSIEADGIIGEIIVTVGKRNSESLPYITQVFDYMPGVGQFTNKLPAYKEGDTQADMNAKVLEAIGKGNSSMITLGGYGGYAVVGFDHTITNVKGKRDFRVYGNAFYAAANPDKDAPEGGSCEPGIIMVAYDKNKNGVPDDDEWYEIAGSAHENHTLEPWYNKAVDAGNDVNFYFNDYELTYYKPESEPADKSEWDTYIRWEDNKGNSGYKVKNQFHNQPYYPLWAEGDKITFKGSRLPENGVDESGQGNYYVLYKFQYGYADNETNLKDDSAIDIDWAVDSEGRKVHLPGVDFIKVYTGVNQENGWLGENSTELSKIEDLHLLGVDIETRK